MKLRHAVDAIKFETKIMDPQLNVPVPADPVDATGTKIFYALSHDLLVKQARFGAAANSETRRAGGARYRTSVRKYSLTKEGWTLVATEDMAVQPAPGIDAKKPASYSEVEQALEKMKQENPARAAGLKIGRPSDLSRVT